MAKTTTKISKKIDGLIMLPSSRSVQTKFIVYISGEAYQLENSDCDEWTFSITYLRAGGHLNMNITYYSESEANKDLNALKDYLFK